MARINIEDSLFRDDRFLELVERTGNRYQAIGLIASAFILAQKHWLKTGLIPNDEWSEQMNILVQCRLASVQDNGVYVVGSKEQFGWLSQKSEAGKSRSKKKIESAENARKSKNKTLNGRTTESERKLNGSNGSEALSLSLSHSLTHNSHSNSLNNNNHETEKKEVSTQVAKAIDVVVFKISSNKVIEIKKDLVTSWSETYPKEFLELSIKEMKNWVLSNEHKAPKSAWAKFMNAWFKRGWEKHRTTIKSNPIKITVEDLNDVLGGVEL